MPSPQTASQRHPPFGGRGRVRVTAGRPSVLGVARPRTVLLVDDDPACCLGMRKLLELDGIEVTIAFDGEDALQHLESEALPDLVLLDIGLPELDGFEVCRRLRQLPGASELVVVALTAFARDEGEEAGFDAHLAKPVDVDDVYAAYAEHVR